MPCRVQGDIRAYRTQEMLGTPEATRLWRQQICHLKALPKPALRVERGIARRASVHLQGDIRRMIQGNLQ